MPTTDHRSPNPESEWFGFKRVNPNDKASLVHQVFASVAGRYDLMNDLMSGGLHRLWKDQLVRMMNPKPGNVLLDVAGGTGDIALRCYRRIQDQIKNNAAEYGHPPPFTGGVRGGLSKQETPSPAKTKDLPRQAQVFASSPSRGEEQRAQITVCDINPAMLKEGHAKATDQGVLSGIDWITGNAEELPILSHSVDIYSIAFGLRNVTRIDKALSEAARVLKPGGRFFCLEFSPGVMPQIKPLYDKYCLSVLPKIGQFVAKDHDSYQYLAESIQQFPTQPRLAERMKKAGLEQVKWLNLTGGIAVIHSGWRL